MTAKCPNCGKDVVPSPVLGEHALYVCPSCQGPISGLDLWMQSHPAEDWPVVLCIPPKVGPKAAVQLQLFPKEDVYRHISEVLGEPYNPEPPRQLPEEVKQWGSKRRP